MARTLNAWLLGAVAIGIVAIGAVVIVAAGIGGGDSNDTASPADATANEQRVMFLNLGMG